MADDRIQMPSGMGGLVRYFDDVQSKIEFKPSALVIMILSVIVVELLLHYFA